MRLSTKYWIPYLKTLIHCTFICSTECKILNNTGFHILKSHSLSLHLFDWVWGCQLYKIPYLKTHTHCYIFSSTDCEVLNNTVQPSSVKASTYIRCQENHGILISLNKQNFRKALMTRRRRQRIIRFLQSWHTFLCDCLDVQWTS